MPSLGDADWQSARGGLGYGSESSADHVPLNVLEERIDVLGCGGAIVHLIRVFVHVHHQNGQGCSRCMGVVRHPVVFELPRVLIEAEQYPARSAAQAGTDATKLGFPSVE